MSPTRTSPVMTSIEMMLVVEQQFAMDVLNTVVKGFGVGRIVKTRNVEEALASMNISPVDIILVDCTGASGGNEAVVHRLRHDLAPPRNAVPIVVLAAHAGEVLVRKYVGAGASFVISKPYNAETLLTRVTWLSHDPREFIAEGAFIGPDRRVRNMGLPTGLAEGRRTSDLPADVGEAGVNLDQNSIDALLKPQKVNLL